MFGRCKEQGCMQHLASLPTSIISVVGFVELVIFDTDSIMG